MIFIFEKAGKIFSISPVPVIIALMAVIHTLMPMGLVRSDS